MFTIIYVYDNICLLSKCAVTVSFDTHKRLLNSAFMSYKCVKLKFVLCYVI